MTYRWIGAVLVVVGCGGFGFSMARETARQEQLLKELLDILDYMENELRGRLTPLPILCGQVARRQKGVLGRLFSGLARALREHRAPAAEDCLRLILGEYKELPGKVRKLLLLLGRSLDRFDLAGQVKGIAATRSACRREVDALLENRDLRLRSYKTLGLCAGAALAVLLI